MTQVNKELDEKLCADYPEIFRDRHAPMTETCMCWGFDCGDGWYHLIDTLCGCLQGYVTSNSNEQVVATQVKEKFGTLRFYYTGGNDMTDGMVWFAEAMSAVTCELCGQPGTLRKGGWLRTLCDPCDDARNSKLKDTTNERAETSGDRK